jgi:hypothetical protein
MAGPSTAPALTLTRAELEAWGEAFGRALRGPALIDRALGSGARFNTASAVESRIEEWLNARW